MLSSFCRAAQSSNGQARGQAQAEVATPVIMHCSAAIGRAGTEAPLEGCQCYEGSHSNITQGTPEGVTLVLCPRQCLWDFVLGPDGLQHAQHSLIGTTVRRTPQGCDARGNAGKGVGLAGPCTKYPHIRCWLSPRHESPTYRAQQQACLAAAGERSLQEQHICNTIAQYQVTAGHMIPHCLQCQPSAARMAAGCPEPRVSRPAPTGRVQQEH